eukprot:TRINITY_DN2530_c0_g1_i1.p1 TRINITY_DN2530_c0_g1~~TRINITY_DN2530_c0_g1_i1.p1  ORF type:complete len:329 (+),score=126.77 TRINITY_DN2530_c0_g1_i1:495-1481(+)
MEGEIVYFEESQNLESMGLDLQSKEQKPSDNESTKQEKKKKSKKQETEDTFEEDDNTPTLHPHRYFENDLPEVGDIVMTKIDSLTEFNAIVLLLEYNNIPATIQFSELSARRIREAPHKILRPGKNEVLQVIRVDPAKRYIDLTRKNITPEETQECFALYSRGKTVQGIASHVVDVVKTITIDEFYNKVIWPLSEKHEHAFFAFKEAVLNPSILDSVELPEDVKKELMKTIHHRLAPKKVKVEAKIEVTCFTAEGVEALIPAFLAGREVAPKVQILIESPPLYSVSTVSTDMEQGVKEVNTAIDAIKKEIEKRKGTLTIRKQAETIAV